MRITSVRITRLVCWAVAFWLALPLSAADVLTWNKQKNRVTADLGGTQLLPLLERVAAQTGWRIFLEPGTDYRSSTKFTELPAGEALRMLLGDINFALIPQTNGVSHLYVFRTALGAATQQISPADAKMILGPKGRITNELIVRLKPGADINEIARLVGAKVIGSIPELNVYRLQFDDAASAEAALAQLLSNPDVTGVDYNYHVARPSVPQIAPSAAAALPELQPKPDSGCGNLVIGVIDTAVQPLGRLEEFVSQRLSVAGEASPDTTAPTHGTAMIESIMNSVASQTKGSSSTKFISVDVFGPSADTSTFNVASGIVRAVNNGANWINLSLGSSGDSALLQDVIKSAADNGVAIFAAAGNEPTGQPVYPAAYPGVTGVTALNRGQVASYANTGDFVDVAAPGAGLVNFNGQAYVTQGTSVSTAFATGTAVGMAEVNCQNWGQVQPGFMKALAVPSAGPE